MDDEWLGCFGDGCTFVGSRRAGAPCDGRLVLGAGAVAAVRRGMVDFTQPPDPLEAGLPGLVRQNTVGDIWDHFANLKSPQAIQDEEWTPRLRFIQRLSEVEGPICDIASGPGGGFVLPIRWFNPNARVLLNDISPGVVALWRDVLVEHEAAEGICFAAFDATRPVLRRGCLAAVSSAWGFGNITGRGRDPVFEAVACMQDALRPGGLVFAHEALSDSRDWAHLPEAQRNAWEAAHPGLGESFADRLRAAGFEIVEREVVPGRVLAPDEGGTPADAARQGITLHIRWELVIARRP